MITNERRIKHYQSLSGFSKFSLWCSVFSIFLPLAVVLPAFLAPVGGGIGGGLGLLEVRHFEDGSVFRVRLLEVCGYLSQHTEIVLGTFRGSCGALRAHCQGRG